MTIHPVYNRQPVSVVRITGADRFASIITLLFASRGDENATSARLRASGTAPFSTHKWSLELSSRVDWSETDTVHG